MIPDAHTPINREQLDADRRLLATPYRPDDIPAQAILVRIAWLAVAVLALVAAWLLLPASTGAAERRVSVTIEQVTGDAGWYVVKLTDGQILVITPPRKAPQLQPGAALMDSEALWQGHWRYPINRRAVTR